MSALADAGWKTDRDGASVEVKSVAAEGIPMRERLEIARDTIIIFALQLLFRTVMALRTWNY